MRAQKIKDFPSLARRCRHCERTGKILPANADASRQNLNARIFPDAFGPKNAQLRWHARLGKQRVRRNAVLAVEIFMGMSKGAEAGMTPAQLKNWQQDSIAWAEAHFGGKANIIAGATNGDETTPHVHLIAIPIDGKGRLNCRQFLGGGAKLRQLQTAYAEAVAKYGLERGIIGSKRKYIPQKILNEWRNQVDRDFKQAVGRLDQVRDEVEKIPVKLWPANRNSILAGLNQVFDETKNELTYSFGLAQEVILARRDAEERQQLIREKNEAQSETAIVKLKADAVLKQNAALVRGLDLVPIAKEILALEPTEVNGVFTFSDGAFELKIEGRKFSGKNPNAKGAGAIDLVMALTGKNNFKEAVELLLSRYSVDNLAADSASQVFAEQNQKIAELKPKPRILTLNDVPPVIWQADQGKWQLIFNRLVKDFSADETVLNNLNKNKLIWATANSQLAFNRTNFEAATKQQQLGVTLLDLSPQELIPRVLAPDLGGAFWLGRTWNEANNIVVVANPLEALSYRRFFPMDNPANTPLPMILSLDSNLPTLALIEKIRKAKKQLTLATNTGLHIDDIKKKLPTLFDADDQLNEWWRLETAKTGIRAENRSRAWTLRLADEIPRQKNYKK